MEVSRKVFFIGSWKTHDVSDRLFREITSQMKTKSGYSTIVKLSPGGLELNILNENGEVSRKERIPLQKIADLAENRYSTTCILAIVREQQNLYKVLVFLCSNEKDAGDMVQGYALLKKSLSGEGYNFDLKPKGTNWTLVTKTEPEVTRQTEYVDGGNETLVNGTTTVYANGGGTSGVKVFTHTRESSAVPVRRVENRGELQTELHQLAHEVRDIKTNLQRAPQGVQGVSYVNKQGYRFTAAPLTVGNTYGNQEVRTQRGQHIKYIRRDGGAQTVAYRGGPRRLASSSTTQKHFLSSTNSLPGSIRMSYQAKPPRSPIVVNQNSQPVIVDQRRTLRRSGASDIVQKNIEDVYKHHRTSKKIVVYPHQERTSEYVQNFQPSVSSTVSVQQPPPKVIQNNQLNEVKNIRYETVGSNNLYENAYVQEPQHVRYVPEQSAYQEESVVTNANTTNVSTLVNTSVNDDLDDNVVHTDAGFDYGQEHGLVREETDQVIIYRAPRQGHRYMKKSEVEMNRKTSAEERSGNVIYIRGEGSEVHEEHSGNVSYMKGEDIHEEHGGNVIYVKGGVADGHEEHSGNVTYVKDDRSDIHEKYGANVIYVGGGRQDAHEYKDVYNETEHVVAGTSEGDEGDVYHVKLEGADAYSHHAENGSYGHHVQSESTTVVHGAPTDLWGAYTQVQERDDPNAEVIATDAYRYHVDDEANVHTTTLNDEEVRIVDYIGDDEARSSSPVPMNRHDNDDDGEAGHGDDDGGDDDHGYDDGGEADLGGDAQDENGDDNESSGVKHVQYAEQLEETMGDRSTEGGGSSGDLSSSQKSRDSNNNPGDDFREDISAKIEEFKKEKEVIIDTLEDEKASKRLLINDEIKRVVETSERTVLF